MEKGYSTGESPEEYHGPSFTTLRRRHWIKEANDPNSKWYRDKNALDGKSPIDENGQKIILHHPYGRQGRNIEIFVPIPENEHIAFHREHGYHYDPIIGWH